MISRVGLVCVLVAACDSSGRTNKDGGLDGWWADPDADAWVSPDAPPPSVDAGPPPAVSCATKPGNPHIDAGPLCPLPPSTCLDQWYLIYYTGGDCVDGSCSYQTNVMYCGGWGCQNGGCVPGFT